MHQRMVRAMSWVMRGTNGLHITCRTKAMAMLCTSFTSSTMAPIDGGVLISVIVLFVSFSWAKTCCSDRKRAHRVRPLKWIVSS